MKDGASRPRDPRAESMIRRDLMPQGVTDSRVLAAFQRVPREAFVPANLADRAYENSALPIAHRQSISQPLMIGLMLQALQARPGDRALDIGTGTGYQAALLAEMGCQVVSVERIEDLAASARERLSGIGYSQIDVHEGDGSLGWPPKAPFDRIIVGCGAPTIPETLAVQLAIGGRMVIPVGSQVTQALTIVIRNSEQQYSTETQGNCCFVPLVGEQGWQEEEGNQDL